MVKPDGYESASCISMNPTTSTIAPMVALELFANSNSSALSVRQLLHVIQYAFPDSTVMMHLVLEVVDAHKLVKGFLGCVVEEARDRSLVHSKFLHARLQVSCDVVVDGHQVLGIFSRQHRHVIDLEHSFQFLDRGSMLVDSQIHVSVAESLVTSFVSDDEERGRLLASSVATSRLPGRKGFEEFIDQIS